MQAGYLKEIIFSNLERFLSAQQQNTTDKLRRVIAYWQGKYPLQEVAKSPYLLFELYYGGYAILGWHAECEDGVSVGLDEIESIGLEILPSADAICFRDGDTNLYDIMAVEWPDEQIDTFFRQYAQCHLDWFVDRWIEAGGMNSGIPAYWTENVQDYFDLSELRWQ